MKIDFNLLRKEKTKRYVLAGYFLVFLLYVFVWIFSSLLKFNLTMEPIFYWILFVGLILIGILLKPKSGLYLWMGFALFISGVFLFFLTFKNASEFLFRNASLLFLYGTILSLIEYRKDAKKEKKKKESF